MSIDDVFQRLGCVALVGGAVVLPIAILLAGRGYLSSGELVGTAAGAGLSIWIGWSILDG